MSISRRTFARLAAVAVAVPNISVAQQPAAAPAPKSDPEVEARIQWIVTKYGAHLDEAQRADIRRIIASGQSSIDDMRKFALDNAIEPATPFRVYRKAAEK